MLKHVMTFAKQEDGTMVVIDEYDIEVEEPKKSKPDLILEILATKGVLSVEEVNQIDSQALG